MGVTFEDLTIEELCDLMCGGVEEEDELQGEAWSLSELREEDV